MSAWGGRTGERVLVAALCAVLASFLLAHCGARSELLRPDGSTDGTTPGATPHAVRLAVGARHACAVLSDGTIRCWGSNTRGQLGDGTTTNRSTPVSVTMPGPVAQLAAGSDHTCALLVDGAVFCWGANESGQLGDGTTSDSPEPRRAHVGSAIEISLGRSHSLALLRDGSVVGFGSNQRCQLGENGAASGPARPIPGFPPDARIAHVAAGGDYSCGLLAEGRLYCAGVLEPNAGSCGLNPDSLLSAGVAVTDVAIGGGHLCVRTRDGRVGCAGLNGLGQLGDGTTRDSTLGWHGDRSVVPQATSIATGATHSCAIDRDGGVWCWGNNAGRQLGLVGSQYSQTPVRVSLGVASTSMALGEAFSCSIGSDDAVRCWGANDVGQLGDGAMTTRAEARVVAF